MSEYKIVVDFNGGQGSSKSQKSKETESAFENTDIMSAFENKFTESIFDFVGKGMIAFAGYNAIKTTAEIGKTIFSQEVQKIGRYTGSQQAQNIANATLSVIGKFANPIGSIINYVYEVDQSNYEMKWESIGLQLYRERGGTALNRSRSET